MTTVYDAYLLILRTLREEPASVARDRAIERLEESAFWASAAIAKVPSPIAHAAGRTPKPSVTSS
jgi:hypothetical protein